MCGRPASCSVGPVDHSSSSRCRLASEKSAAYYQYLPLSLFLSLFLQHEDHEEDPED